MAAKNRAFVVGVGMTKFEKPGGDKDYPDFAKEAGQRALEDACLSYEAIEQVFLIERVIGNNWQVHSNIIEHYLLNTNLQTLMQYLAMWGGGRREVGVTLEMGF